MYKCKICGKEFESQQAQASHTFHFHSSKEIKNKAREKLSKTNKLKRVKINKICPKCGTKFEVERNLNKDGSIRIPKFEKIYCSRSCANGQNHTKEWNKKISKSLRIERSPRFCKMCGKEISHKNKTSYCLDCWRKSEEYSLTMSKATKGKTGGYNEGSVKNYKSGRYDGIWFDSSWELAYYLYHKENDVNIIRCDENFPYVYEGVKRKYHPDFIIDDTYIEIKGYEQPETDAKIRDFPHKLEVVRREDIKHILEYVENKYGKEFWKEFYI
jgi:hypothetical protein